MKCSDYFLYKWFSIKRYYRSTKRFIKSTYQRLTKGYADAECWSLDYSLAKWILPRLKHFRNNLTGTPARLENIGDDCIGHCVTPEVKCSCNSLTMEEWQEKLDQMIYAFEFILTEDDILQECYPKDYKWGFSTTENGIVWKDDRKPDYTYYNECQEKYKIGIKAFSVYFRNLWD